MDKEKLSSVLGPIIKEKPIEKFTAEEYVVIKLQQAENELNRSTALLAKERENNMFLNRKNELLVKITDFIFKNFDFYFGNTNSLHVSYGHADVVDETLKSSIDKFIKEFKQTEEDIKEE